MQRVLSLSPTYMPKWFPSSEQRFTHSVSQRPPQASWWHPLLIKLSCITTPGWTWEAYRCSRGFFFYHFWDGTEKLLNVKYSRWRGKKRNKLTISFREPLKNLASFLKRELGIPFFASVSLQRSSCMSVIMYYWDTFQLKCQGLQWNDFIKPYKILVKSTSGKWGLAIYSPCSVMGAWSSVMRNDNSVTSVDVSHQPDFT